MNRTRQHSALLKYQVEAQIYALLRFRTLKSIRAGSGIEPKSIGFLIFTLSTHQLPYLTAWKCIIRRWVIFMLNSAVYMMILSTRQERSASTRATSLQTVRLCFIQHTFRKGLLHSSNMFLKISEHNVTAGLIYVIFRNFPTSFSFYVSFIQKRNTYDNTVLSPNSSRFVRLRILRDGKRNYWI